MIEWWQIVLLIIGLIALLIPFTLAAVALASRVSEQERRTRGHD